MHSHKVFPLLTGYFTVAFKNSGKFPKVENIPSFIFDNHREENPLL